MDETVKPTRREFLYPVTAGVGLATLGLGAWAVLRGAAPIAADAPMVSVDLAGIAEGTERIIALGTWPLMIRHRRVQEIAFAEVADGADLIDTLARNANLDPSAPATDKNRRASPDGRFVIFSKGCSYRGCHLAREEGTDWSGWHCPCCGARYDNAGRIRAGLPNQNLSIPLYSLRNGRFLHVYHRNRISGGELP